MEKIMSKEENSLGLDVYINGYVNVKNIPTDILNSISYNMEIAISKYFAEKQKHKCSKKKSFKNVP